MTAANVEALVQPILLPKDARTIAEADVITAVARASAVAYLQRRPEDECRWRAWLSGPFTKSVRVAKSRAAFEETAACGAATRMPADGEPIALALPPSPYAEYPRALSAARVQGLRCAPPTVPHPPLAVLSDCGLRSWLIVLRSDLEWTSGKQAAQAAHAMMMVAVAEALTIEDVTVIPVVYTDDLSMVLDCDDVQSYRVVDAGLTEFGGEPTLTCAAVKWIS